MSTQKKIVNGCDVCGKEDAKGLKLFSIPFRVYSHHLCVPCFNVAAQKYKKEVAKEIKE